MSYYYSYYIGYRDTKTNKIYPWGPYDAKGNLCYVLNRSRSFTSDLHEDFYFIKEDEISDELRAKFEHDYDGTKKVNVKYLPVSELPSGSYIDKGYFLIEDVEAYERDEFNFDGFYDRLSPHVYVAKLENQLKFGPNKPKEDDFGNTYTEHNASDYMFYAYPNKQSKEYEAHILRYAVSVLEDYRLKDVEYVILETEG